MRAELGHTHDLPERRRQFVAELAVLANVIRDLATRA